MRDGFMFSFLIVQFSYKCFTPPVSHTVYKPCLTACINFGRCYFMYLRPQKEPLTYIT